MMSSKYLAIMKHPNYNKVNKIIRKVSLELNINHNFGFRYAKWRQAVLQNLKVQEEFQCSV